MAGDMTVKIGSGDNLSKIAKEYGISVKELAEANGIKNIDVLQIGQELKIPGTELEHTDTPEMSEDDFNKRFQENERRLKELEGRSVASQLKQEVSEAVAETVDDVKEWGAEKYQQAKEVAQATGEYVAEKAEAAWDGAKEVAHATGEYVAEKAEEAWDATKEAAKGTANFVAGVSVAAAEAVVDGAKTAAGAVADGAEAAWDGVKGVHNAKVEMTEDAAKWAAGQAKDAAKGFFNAIRADVEPKEKPVDTSNMTKEELLAYQEKRINDLEKESVVDRATREFKEGYNEVVDGTENMASKIYNGVKDAAKAVFNWWKW